MRRTNGEEVETEEEEDEDARKENTTKHDVELEKGLRVAGEEVATTMKNGITDACSTTDCCPLLTTCPRCCPRDSPDDVIIHCGYHRLPPESGVQMALSLELLNTAPYLLIEP